MAPVMDPITLDRIATAHPRVREDLKAIYAEICERLKGRVMCRFAYVLRTFEEQDALYAQGRTKPGKVVTNARGGQSYHNYGLAVDIVLLIDKDGNGTYDTASWDRNADTDQDGQKDWEEVVFVFKMHGWEWGGDWTSFKDYPHFQKTYGQGIPILQLRHRTENFDGEGYPHLG